MVSPRLLIVEDEAIVAEDISSRLTTMGYRVVGIVAAGEDAIAFTAQEQPDLILMDIMLQGILDGIDTAKQIYQQWVIPIVYLTAYGDEKTLQRAKFAGSFGYLIKPFKELDLRATIEIALARYQAEAQIQQALHAERQQPVQLTAQPPSAEYMSIASHELRNPLSHIKLWAQLLQRHEHSWSSQKKREGLQQIQTSAEQIAQLLDDLLSLGRSDTPEENLQSKSLNLNSFCQKVLRNHQFIAGSRFQLLFDPPAEVLEILINETLIGYILNNLLANAIKYSPFGGEIRFNLFRQDEGIGLQICDRGIGIPPADQPSLFTPFYRGSNVGDIVGTGLGLVIVKRCVERCSGRLTLESQIDQGTTVTVWLPILEPV